MSKKTDSSKVNWVDVDRRIRDRQKFWQGKQVKEFDAQLSALPDLAEQVEIVDIEQPAVASPRADEPGQGAADDVAGATEAVLDRPSTDEASRG